MWQLFKPKTYLPALFWLRLFGLSLLLIISLNNCGTNTQSPVYPINSIIAVGSPAIVNVEPIVPTDAHAAPSFKISYYVTNQENEFIGYNLYISQSAQSSEAIQIGAAGLPYFPNGIEPTFRHLTSEVSTAAQNLKTQTVANFKAAPSPQPFQYCRTYYFALRAVVRNGQVSAPGPQISSCLTDAFYCPTASDCDK